MDRPDNAPPGWRRRTLLLFLAVGLYSAGSAAEPPASKPKTPAGNYLNPLGEPPIHLLDPFILVNAKKYYLFGTASPSEGFQCYESSDLAHWKLDGWAWRKVGLHVATGGLRSPQVFLYGGMFCLVYSARMPTGTYLALAASFRAEGPYHDLHAPWLSLGDGCLGGNVFVDGDGKPYLTFSQRTPRKQSNHTAIFGVALSQDLSKTVGQPVKLLEASQRWELLRRDANPCNEGGRILKLGAKYYLTYSANDQLSPEYGIGCASADKPLGPWTKSSGNPLLASHPEVGVLGPGHGSVFRSISGGEWFMVYDSLADPAHRPDDRVVNIDRLALQSTRDLIVKGPTRSPQPLPSGPK